MVSKNEKISPKKIKVLGKNKNINFKIFWALKKRKILTPKFFEVPKNEKY